MMRIVHITSMHDQDDDRIFQRACIALAREGHEVSLIVTYPSDELIHGVSIIGLKARTGWRRRIFSSGEAFFKALKLKGDIFHFHDPDLLPWMILLKILGRTVVYDIHEIYTVRFSTWRLPKVVGILGAKIYQYLEFAAIRMFDGVIVTSESMGVVFKKVARNLGVIRNIHDLNRLSDVDLTQPKDPYPVIYTSGTNGPDRHCVEMLEALPLVLDRIPNAVMRFAGYYSPGYREQILFKARELGIEDHVQLEGSAPYIEHIQRTLRAHVGCVFLKYNEKNIVATSNRLFEYMFCGMPVIVENFPEPRRVIEKTGCGILVDSTSTQQVADAMLRILLDSKLADNMGRRGREAVINEYNFSKDLQKLVSLYSKIAASG